MLHRAYSQFEIKSVDEESRVIEGMATTPEPDRLGDIVVPEGAKFTLPLPLLWQHRSEQPIGHVTHATVTKDGISIRAKLSKIDEPGTLKNRLDEAWLSIKHQLVRGLSIGFNPLESVRIEGTFSFKFPAWEWLELSAVTIPANSDASITTIRSIASQDLAASGTGQTGVSSTRPGVSGHVVVRAKGASPMKKTIQEQIKDFETTRAAKDAERTALMDKAAEAGETLDKDASETYDTLTAEIKSVDAHLARLRDMDTANVAAAKAVHGTDPHTASVSRSPSAVVSVSRTLPPGIEFAQAVLCKVASFVAFQRGEALSSVDVAKQRYPDNGRIQQYLKGAVPAGTTADAVWASPLVDPTNLASEFIEFLRPQTIIGRVPNLRRIPFNVRIVGQTSGGDGYWVGQGAPKPLTSYAFNATTHTWAKVAAIAVISEELARFSSPSAEALVRDALAGSLIERLDIDFIDPAKAISANVSPASITNGLTALSSAGTSADNIRTDMQNLLEQFILNNVNPTGVVLIMPNTLALAASLLVNSLGQPEFPGLTMNGGTLVGLPVITSQYAANQSGGGNLVIAVNAPDIFLSDDGQVTVDASRETSLQMLDNPTNNSATATATTMVSMFQTNSIALRAERFINWSKRRASSVVYMDDVNWGSIGSPS